MTNTEQTRRKLEKLTQDEHGDLLSARGTILQRQYVLNVGKLQTGVVENAEGIDIHIERMCARNSCLIPPTANAYYSSEFNGGTQHVRINPNTGEEKMFSFYAVQFVYSLDIAQEQEEL